MKNTKTLPIILVLLLLFSLSSSMIENVTSVDSGQKASITNVSMVEAFNPQNTLPDHNSIREVNNMVDKNRIKPVEDPLSFNERKTLLNNYYGFDQNNKYTTSNSRYDPHIKQLNQLIVTFTSQEAKRALLQNVPKELIVHDFEIIPSVVLLKDQLNYDLILSSNSVIDMMGDVIFDLPDFNVEEKEKFETSFFNSEGRIGTWYMHDLGYTGKNVKISVLDTGIDNTHEDLLYLRDGSPKVINQQSFVPGEGPEDFIGHGTHVAGTTAGNGRHIGVAPDAQLLNAKVCSFSGCATSWMLEAIEWSIMQDVDVITMSIGGSTFFGTDPLDFIIDYAWQTGIVLTIAAGNAGPGTSTVSSPGVGPRVITVGATDVYDLVTGFSGRGPSVYGNFDPDISAPGQGVFSTLPGNTYGIYSGTSMATPHVAGSIALLMEAHPKSNNDEIKANLMESGKKMDQFSSNIQGAGLVDLKTTHQNWNKKVGTIFPKLSSLDTFYLTPGETFTGVFDFIRGNRGVVPVFKTDKSNAFQILIDNQALDPTISGHQFVPFIITAPQDSSVGDILSRQIILEYPKHHDPMMFRPFGYWQMEVVIEIVEPEDDANFGFDASDTFIGANELNLGDYSGIARDIDFYKIYLEEGIAYKFMLDGMIGVSDFDLGVYDVSGALACNICDIFLGGTSPETIIVTAQYSGYYFIRVDAWSVMYLDPYIGFDSSGPYNLHIEIDTGNGGGEPPTGTQLDFIEAVLYGLDVDSDGINDFLAIDVTLDVTSIGILDVYAFLALDKGEPLEKYFFAVAFEELYEFNTLGLQTITLLLDATYFADQQFDGTVVLYELFMGDPSTFTILHDLFYVTSSQLNSADFGTTHMTYNYLNFATIDYDGDNVGDLLEVTVSVNIETTFDWVTYFYATLFHPDNYFIYSVNEAFIDLISPGEKLLQFYFLPDDFLTEDGGLLDLELVITYSWDHPMLIDSQHFGSFPYILTIGDTFTIDQAEYQQFTMNSIDSITDRAYDSDNDGAFDYLVIDAVVSITEAGYFALSFHPWIWSISDQAVLFDFESDPYDSIMWLDEGQQVISMPISGELINAMQIDGPFMFINIWLDSFELMEWGFSYTGTPDNFQNYITHEFEWSDFDTTGVRYLGISSVNYLDLTGDDLAETVELVIDIDVGYVGEFYFILLMFDYPLGGYYFVDFIDFYQYFDETGVQSISLFLDGRQFWNTGYSGQIEIWEIDIFNLQTGKFTYFDFQNGLFDIDYLELPGAAPPGTIINVFDYPVDTNDNGLYEYIAVDVTIETTSEGYFFTYMDVFGGEMFWYYVGFYSADLYAPEAGTYILTMIIPSTDLLSNIFDDVTSLELWIWLYDDSGLNDMVGPLYTDYYDLNMFERPASIISITDSGVDDNNNGLFESVQVTLTIEVNSPGQYYFDMESYVGETGEWLGYTYAELLALDAGIYLIDMYIAGSMIKMSSVDYTNFELWIFMWGESGLVDQVFGFYTNFYYTSDFESEADITNISDFGVDNDGNGKFEFINIVITVDVSLAGFYSIDLSMYGNDDNQYNEFVVGYYDSFDLSTGIHDISILLPTTLILSRLSDDYTNFETYISLNFENNLIADVIYYTNYYSMDDLELIASVNYAFDFGYDPDSDGLFEYLAITVETEFFKTGDFTVVVVLYAESDFSFVEIGWYELPFSAISPGIYTFEFLVPASDILAAVMESNFVFSYLGAILDATPYVVTFGGPFYSLPYSVTDFDTE